MTRTNIAIAPKEHGRLREYKFATRCNSFSEAIDRLLEEQDEVDLSEAERPRAGAQEV